MLSNEGLGGFYQVLICTYDEVKKEIVVVENIENSYGYPRYDENTMEINYTDFRPFKDAMAYGFYKLENNKLVKTKCVGQDMGQFFVEENGNETSIQAEESNDFFKNSKEFEFLDISNLDISASNDETLKVGDCTLKYGTYEMDVSYYEDCYGTITLEPNGKCHIKSNVEYDLNNKTAIDTDATYEVKLGLDTEGDGIYDENGIVFTIKDKEVTFVVSKNDAFNDQWHGYNYSGN